MKSVSLPGDVENSHRLLVAVSSKHTQESRTPICSCNPISGYISKEDTNRMSEKSVLPWLLLPEHNSQDRINMMTVNREDMAYVDNEMISSYQENSVTQSDKDGTGGH